MGDDEKAFKHGIGEPAVRRIAHNLKRAAPSFAEERFVKNALSGLGALELKARVQHLVEVLRAQLPEDERAAIALLVEAGELWDRGDAGDAKAGFAAWPLLEFIGVYGLAHFELSMDALRRLTGLFSAEFAIRSFIERDEARALQVLARWAADPDPHVRRLVSEGTRPRLPWGRRLRSFQRNPAPVIELLELLKDDAAEYVRRSVGNNLNDIAKDHPQEVIALCRRWIVGASAERQRIVRRATRSLVKEGDSAALALLGFDPEAAVQLVDFSVTPGRIALGAELSLGIELRSEAGHEQALVVDFALHHVRQGGGRRAKVFKLKNVVLGPNETLRITKKHPLRRVTTRTYYSGRHGVELLINGRSCAMAEFELEA